MRSLPIRLTAAVLVALCVAPPFAKPRELTRQRLEVRPGVYLPVEASQDLAAPALQARRVVVVLHGQGRNVEGYFRYASEAARNAGVAAETVIVAPQFLTVGDARETGAPASFLRFRGPDWLDGEPARAPEPVSAFEALDALLARLADRAAFPKLDRVAIVGHSAGGQLAQRFAILTQKAPALAKMGIALRFVVANPSSYAWFGEERPHPEIAKTCAGYADWKYGFATPPPYAAGRDADDLERAYVARDVVYLLGGADTDPNHPELDKSCKAESQGATRWERGHAFFAALRARDGNALKQRLLAVPGVGHEARRMLTSPCGLAAIFDTPGCKAEP